MSAKSKINMDDGFNPEFVETSMFDEILEIPCIEREELSIIPQKAIPINELNKNDGHSELVISLEILKMMSTFCQPIL